MPCASGPLTTSHRFGRAERGPLACRAHRSLNLWTGILQHDSRALVLSPSPDQASNRHHGPVRPPWPPTNCGTDPAAPNSLTDSPRHGEPTASTAAPTPRLLASALANTSPFGPVGLWDTPTTVSWGPKPFTFSQNSNNPSSIVTQISTAAQHGQRLVLALARPTRTIPPAEGSTSPSGRAHERLQHHGHQERHGGGGVRTAPSSGTCSSTSRRPSGGAGASTRGSMDQLASYAKNIFPTLPQGLNHGPPGYKWHTEQTYKVVDYVLYQYNWWVTTGDVNAWRSTVLARAKADGVRPALAPERPGRRVSRIGVVPVTAPAADRQAKGTYYSELQDDPGPGGELGQGADRVRLLHHAVEVRLRLYAEVRQPDGVQSVGHRLGVQAAPELQAAVAAVIQCPAPQRNAGGTGRAVPPPSVFEAPSLALAAVRRKPAASGSPHPSHRPPSIGPRRSTLSYTARVLLTDRSSAKWVSYSVRPRCPGWREAPDRRAGAAIGPAAPRRRLAARRNR